VGTCIITYITGFSVNFFLLQNMLIRLQVKGRSKMNCIFLLTLKTARKDICMVYVLELSPI